MRFADEKPSLREVTDRGCAEPSRDYGKHCREVPKQSTLRDSRVYNQCIMYYYYVVCLLALS